jgi:hypothetical protein
MRRATYLYDRNTVEKIEGVRANSTEEIRGGATRNFFAPIVCRFGHRCHDQTSGHCSLLRRRTGTTLRRLLTKDEAPRIAANLAKAAGSCWQGFSAAQARPRSGKAVMIS